MRPLLRFSLVLLLGMSCGCGQKGIYSKGYYSGSAHHWSKRIHTVAPGETLYSIAWMHGQDYRDVARWNHIASPYTIYPNQKLRVVKPDTLPPRQPRKLTKIHKSPHPVNAEKETVPAAKPVRKTRLASHRLHWQWPVQGRIISRFSENNPGQQGIDIAAHDGAAIYAAEAGQVVYSGSGLRGYGKLIIIKHNETFLSAYAHNRDLRVKEGEKVKKGEHIADMGNTGAERVKLHFEIRRNGTPVNPFRYLPKQ